MLRLFVALSLPGPVAHALALTQGGVPGARWVRPENLHLTLRFVGEVDRYVAEEVDAALERVAAPGFWLRLAGVGSFQNGRRATALWAGAERSDPLQHLHDKVDRALVAAGAEPDPRKFAPHVTVARLRNAAPDRVRRWVEEHNLFSTAPFPVARFTLFESHLGVGGPVYRPLAHYGLHPPQGEDAGGWLEAVDRLAEAEREVPGNEIAAAAPRPR